VVGGEKRNRGGKQGTARLFVIAFSVIGKKWERGVSFIVAIEVAFDVARVDVNVRGRESIVEVKACFLVRNRLEEEENCVHDLLDLVRGDIQNPLAC
jgi:hypothetical protein